MGNIKTELCLILKLISKLISNFLFFSFFYVSVIFL